VQTGASKGRRYRSPPSEVGCRNPSSSSIGTSLLQRQHQRSFIRITRPFNVLLVLRRDLVFLRSLPHKNSLWPQYEMHAIRFEQPPLFCKPIFVRTVRKHVKLITTTEIHLEAAEVIRLDSLDYQLIRNVLARVRFYVKALKQFQDALFLKVGRRTALLLPIRRVSRQSAGTQ
jgi:hypothetical protein